MCPFHSINDNPIIHRTSPQSLLWNVHMTYMSDLVLVLGQRHMPRIKTLGNTFLAKSITFSLLRMRKLLFSGQKKFLRPVFRSARTSYRAFVRPSIRPVRNNFSWVHRWAVTLQSGLRNPSNRLFSERWWWQLCKFEQKYKDKDKYTDKYKDRDK